MKITVCQLDLALVERADYLKALSEHAENHQSDFVLLPEMPFSDWLASDPNPDARRWMNSIEAHDKGIAQLQNLGVDHVVGTRPIVNEGGSRRNQAFLWSAQNGRAIPFHEKHYLPNEEGYWEETWYERGLKSFDTIRVNDAILGVQICTEMWFFEWARHYAASRVDALCVPRATPRSSVDRWLAGGCAAAVCSGAYCLSSNLYTAPGSRTDCGGLGWVVDPEGEVLATTTPDQPFATVEIDLGVSRRAKQTYPRSVPG